MIPLNSVSQTKRALVIAVGEQIDQEWDKINADKDLYYVLDMLHKADYQQIITCVNEEATKKGILSMFEELENSCGKNDIVYIQFSGHGQQMEDTDGDEKDDNKDECWIPYDAYCSPCDKDWGEKHLVDDEINILLNGIYNKIGDGGKMLVVVDACHSGGSTRGNAVIRGTHLKFKPKSLNDKLSDKSVTKENWITLSACKSGQTNYEMQDPVVGKLTYALCEIVNNNDFLDNKDFEEQITRYVNNNSPIEPQEAEMSGEAIGRYHIMNILK